MDFSARMPSSSEYVQALEEERKKIQVFQRELPLCLHLVTHAIETVRKQMGVNAAAEAASDDVPVLEEFIQLKPSSYSSSSDDDRSGVDGDAERGAAAAATRKPDWLRSVQLWSQNGADTAAAMVAAPTKPVAVNAKRMAGAFHPFERDKRVAAPAVSAAAGSSSTSRGAGGAGGAGGGGEEKEKEGQSQLAHRKVRRNWSAELHRRFMEALEQLGGPHVATPKQIREVMKVDGLTNDEVKSHLQKFRLHNRRPCTTTTTALVQTNINSSSTPIPQFVVVGGIWVPPPTAAAPVDGPPALAGCGAMFAPVTSILPSQLRSFQQQAEKKQQSKCITTREENKSNGDDDDVSPTTSFSSSQTTTASHLRTSS